MKKNILAGLVGACLCGVLVMLFAGPALAGDTDWVLPPPDEGDWFEPLNWDNGVPTSAVNAYIDNGGTAQVSALSAGAHDLNIGYASTGAVEQAGGVLSVKRYLRLGYNTGAYGSYALSGGELKVDGTTIGYLGTAEFTQTGGIHTVDKLWIGSGGTYSLSGGTLLIRPDSYSGEEEIQGSFVQSGGIHTVGDGDILVLSGGDATYALSSGALNVDSEIIGYYSNSTFTQTGGRHTVTHDLKVGYDGVSDATYQLSDGDLVVYEDEILGTGGGKGTFIQSAGTHTVHGCLYISEQGGRCGSYELEGGQLSSDQLHVGYYGIGSFTQSAGLNTARFVSVSTYNQGSRYELSGGTLQVNAGLDLAGELDFAGGPSTLAADNALVNLSQGTVLNASNASLDIGPNSLLIVAPGFDPATAFGSYSNAGMLHTAGEPLRVELGEGFGGWGRIDDFVESAGTIAAASGGYINLNAGVFVSGGSVDLGTGSLLIEAPGSGLSQGELRVGGNLDIGRSGHGTFVQSGGTHIVNGTVQLAYYGSTTAAYELSAGDFLVDRSEYVGTKGTATFTQTGGTHYIGDCLYVGYDTSSHGTYTLSDGELHVAYEENIGWRGTGVFIQTGGKHIIDRTLSLSTDWGEGHYTLSGGELIARNVFVADNDSHKAATFTQTGGTFTAENVMLAAYTGRACEATYTLSGGELVVQNGLYLSRKVGKATLNVDGGKLTTGQLVVEPAFYSTAVLNLNSAAARVEVQEKFRLGYYATLNAVPGAKIHMTGSAFENESTNPDALAGLGNLELVFEGGTADTDPFEVAGEDRGAVYSGFVKNFTFGGLTLGGADVGQVQLVDNFDNGNRGGLAGASEAQYVKRLQVGAGSTLDLNNLNLYYLKGAIDPSATILPGAGSLTWVPPVESVNATFLDSVFTPTGGDHGLGMLTVADGADVVVEIGDGTQTTHAGGHFTLAASLFSDTSTGGVAAGLFQGGTIDVEDAVGADLLTGDLLDLLLEEIQGQNLLAGSGQFALTGGSLEGGFVGSVGEVVQITFQIHPKDIADFSGGFTGVSNITLTPEPATLALLAAGLGAIGLKRRRKT